MGRKTRQTGYQIGAASPIFTDMMRPSRYKALYGGRGSAKSHFFAEAMVGNAAQNNGFRAVCVREVQKSLKESAKRLIEDKIKDMGFGAKFKILHDRIVTPGDGVIIFEGMQDHNSESIKSLEGFNVAWVEEGQTLSARSLEMLRPTIRAPGSELWFSWNPRNPKDPVDAFFRGEKPPEDAVIKRISYEDNVLFPAELEDERRHDRETYPDRYGHIWLGDYEPVALGAIWNRQILHEQRRTEDDLPAMGRVVVAVDPAVSSEDGSNEHGIVVAGLGEDGRGYVLEDATTKGDPIKWAQRVGHAYDANEADAVVIEVNQGGDMVKHTIRSVRPDLPVVEVRATRGKHVRAEPIAALYGLGRVSHVGTYPELEDQMCKMTAAGYEGDGSPDRCDALVWALTELFPKMVKKAAPKRRRRRARVVSSDGWMAA